MRTSNPTFAENIFEKEIDHAGGMPMTIQGTINKTMILFGILLVAAWWIWSKVMVPTQALGFDVETLARQNQAAVMPFIMGGGIAGFVFALVTVFKKQWAGYTAPIYAVCEGLFLGGLSALFEMMYPGIVIQAVGLTFSVLFCMLMAYKTGFIRVTDKLRLGIVVATAGIALFYLVVMVAGMFGVMPPGFISGSSPLGIAFSLFVVGIASLNLVLDFDMIDRGSEAGAPQYMEWYCAFGLMVTLVWLYMEILRLLAKLRGRD